jgi:hypothetical protein
VPAPSRTADPATAPDHRDARPGRSRSEITREVLALAIVLFAFLLPLRGLLRTQGPPMEEGFMLVFPERVLEGDIPNKDFLHLYGPGSLWALAGTFKVFGVSLITERLFGLAQQMLVVFGVYALARAWGRRIAVCSALTCALILVPFGLTALAWVGALGLALAGLKVALHARHARDDRAARAPAFGAGLLFGLALLFRPDLVVAVGLGVLVVLWTASRPVRTRIAAGAALGVAPYLVHVAMAGPGNAIQGMILDPVFELRGGRSLPVPPPWGRLDGFLQRAGALEQLDWPFPTPRVSQQLFLWFFLLLATVAVLVATAIWRTRVAPGTRRTRILLALALFSAGLLPQAIQRADSAHLAWVGCVPFGFLAIALYELVRTRAVRARRSPARATSLVCGGAVLLLVAVTFPSFTSRLYADYALQSFGVHRTAHRIEQDGRVFYYGSAARASAAQMVIDEAARITEPGDRVFVGPANLRKTPYSDAYLYYMLPDLVPATYYIEMDPGVANAEGSGLAEDLASADIAILSAIWDDWDEPNDSRVAGSDESERVLEEQFCLVGDFGGLYRLYERCT